MLLLWVCWKMWRELRHPPRGATPPRRRSQAATSTPTATIAGGAPRKTFAQAARQIVIADVSMSLDNVLAVAGAAREHPMVLIFGLVLSIALMGIAAPSSRGCCRGTAGSPMSASSSSSMSRWR